ncbi:MAG: ParB N-terminal domain-containing protein [Proteobacteria bacterium]|nr:ParB N-terminal domain-containing protein [Pseudomonadota bacterium]
MLLQYLPVSEINLADSSYRITFAPELEALTRSIKAVGVIQPINVRHTPDHTYQIVTGYKRVLVMQELARQTLPALVHEPADLSPTQAFMWSLHDNAATRELNLIEKSISLTKLNQFCQVSEAEMVKRFLPLFGLDPSYRTLHQLMSLNELTEPLKGYAVSSDLALSSASRIAEFSSSTQQELLPVLTQIRPSASKLNELLTLIREIAARDGLTVEEILQRYQFMQVVADRASSAADKVRHLRQALRGIKIPQLAERQNQIASLIQNLDLPDSAKVVHDPYFEDERIKLECHFSTPEEIEQLANKIQEAFQRQHWHQIFDWYKA